MKIKEKIHRSLTFFSVIAGFAAWNQVAGSGASTPCQGYDVVHRDLLGSEIDPAVVAGRLGDTILPPSAFSEFSSLGFFAADEVDDTLPGEELFGVEDACGWVSPLLRAPFYVTMTQKSQNGSLLNRCKRLPHGFAGGGFGQCRFRYESCWLEDTLRALKVPKTYEANEDDPWHRSASVK